MVNLIFGILGGVFGGIGVFAEIFIRIQTLRPPWNFIGYRTPNRITPVNCIAFSILSFPPLRSDLVTKQQRA